jgi:hypothetical protein
VQDQTLDDLASRLKTACLPSNASDDWSEGMNPAYLRELVEYWRDEFDWRAETQPNPSQSTSRMNRRICARPRPYATVSKSSLAVRTVAVEDN